MGSTVCKFHSKSSGIDLLHIWVTMEGQSTTVAKYYVQRYQEARRILETGYHGKTVDAGVHEVDLVFGAGDDSYFVNCMSRVQAIVFYIDPATTEQGFEFVFEKMTKLFEKNGVRDIPLAIAASRRDMYQKYYARYLTLKLRSMSYLIGRTWKVFPVSSVTGEGLRRMLQWVVTNIDSSITFEPVVVRRNAWS